MSIHEFARNGNIGELEQLLNVGDLTKSIQVVNEKDKLERTPLHLSSFFGHLDAVKILLEYKADVHAGAVDGFTPLHFAAQNGHVDILARRY